MKSATVSLAFALATLVPQASNAAPEKAAAQGGPPPMSSMAAGKRADVKAIDLPVQIAAENCGPEQWFSWAGETSVRNIGKPTLLPILPANGTANGTAVIVAPGGGFTGLRYEGEGLVAARELARRGITAFVLKYRVKCTPRADEDLKKFLGATMAEAAKHPGNADFPAYAPATADARAAISYVRKHAAELGVNPARIGFLGFSAGAITALATSEVSQTDDAPNFIAPIYPQMNNKLNIPQKPAPMFLAIAGNDSLFGRQGTEIVSHWQAAGGSVELHFYQGDEHGFAFEKRGTTSDHWFEEFIWWLEAQNLLAKPKS